MFVVCLLCFCLFNVCWRLIVARRCLLLAAPRCCLLFVVNCYVSVVAVCCLL